MDAMMQALLGGDALTDDEKLRKTANALRGADNAAQVFSMSSIAPIAKSAQNQRSLISDAASRGGVLREGALRRKQEEEESRNALKQATAQRIEDRRNEITDRDENNRVKFLIKSMGLDGKKDDKDGGYITYTPKDYEKAQQALETSAGQLYALDKVLNNPHMTSADPTENWRFNYGKYVPLVGDLDDEANQRQQDLIEYRRIYETPERHGFYGGALTDPEIKEYRKIQLLPTRDEKQFKAQAQAMKNLMIRVAQRRYNKMRFKVPNKEQLQNDFADVVNYFVFDDKGKVVGLKGDFSNEEMMKNAKTTKDIEKSPIAKARADAKKRRELSPIAQAQADAQASAAPAAQATQGQQVQAGTPEAALSAIGMDAGTLASLAESNPDQFKKILTKYPVLLDSF